MSDLALAMSNVVSSTRNCMRTLLRSSTAERESTAYQRRRRRPQAGETWQLVQRALPRAQHLSWGHWQSISAIGGANVLSGQRGRSLRLTRPSCDLHGLRDC